MTCKAPKGLRFNTIQCDRAGMSSTIVTTTALVNEPLASAVQFKTPCIRAPARDPL